MLAWLVELNKCLAGITKPTCDDVCSAQLLPICPNQLKWNFELLYQHKALSICSLVIPVATLTLNKHCCTSLLLCEHMTAYAKEVLMEACFVAPAWNNESVTVRTLPSGALLTLRDLMLNSGLLHNPIFFLFGCSGYMFKCDLSAECNVKSSISWRDPHVEH